MALEIGDWAISKYQQDDSIMMVRSIEEIDQEVDLNYKRLEELNLKSKEMRFA